MLLPTWVTRNASPTCGGRHCSVLGRCSANRERGSGLADFPAALFETDNGLAAGDRDLAVDHRTFSHSYAAGDDIGADHSRSAHLELFLDHQFSRNPTCDHRGLSVDLAFPFGPGRHAQRT